MNELPLEPVKRLIRNSTNMRVSDNAGEELKSVLENNGEKIARVAMRFAESGNRRTVRADDIERAIKTIFEQ